MALKGKIIRIAGDAGGSTRIGINGRHRLIPHNEDVPVSAAELEVLENSHVRFDIKGDASAADLKGAVDADTESTAMGSVDPGTDRDGSQIAGADYLPTPEPTPPALAVRTTPPDDETPAGADHLTQTEEADEGAALEEAQEAQRAAAEGTTEPVVELTNADPHQLGAYQTETTATGDNEGNAPTGFNSHEVLHGTVPEITARLDSFTKRQLRALATAEGKAEKPRASLIEAIEAKLAE